MAASAQTRGHSGHGHGHHHHHHDNVYLTSQNKNDAGVRITRLGLFSNLGMAVAKGVGGYAFNSQAMVADAIHSVTDMASDVLTLATISWSLRPPTDKFPTGYGKIESLGSLGVSGMLLIGGLWMGYGSLLSLYGHFFLDPAAADANFRRLIELSDAPSQHRLSAVLWPEAAATFLVEVLASFDMAQRALRERGPAE